MMGLETIAGYLKAKYCVGTVLVKTGTCSPTASPVTDVCIMQLNVVAKAAGQSAAENWISGAIGVLSKGATPFIIVGSLSGLGMYYAGAYLYDFHNLKEIYMVIQQVSIDADLCTRLAQLYPDLNAINQAASDLIANKTHKSKDICDAVVRLCINTGRPSISNIIIDLTNTQL
jgi:hypothetical protein